MNESILIYNVSEVSINLPLARNRIKYGSIAFYPGETVRLQRHLISAFQKPYWNVLARTRLRTGAGGEAKNGVKQEKLGSEAGWVVDWDYRSAGRFAGRFFLPFRIFSSPFPPTAEPGPRLCLFVEKSKTNKFNLTKTNQEPNPQNQYLKFDSNHIMRLNIHSPHFVSSSFWTCILCTQCLGCLAARLQSSSQVSALLKHQNVLHSVFYAFLFCDFQLKSSQAKEKMQISKNQYHKGKAWECCSAIFHICGSGMYVD